MKLLFTLLSLGSILLAFPQESKVYFDDALSKYLVPYHKESSEAITNHEFERAEFLFDSLMKFHLKGTYIPNLKLKKIPKGSIETDSLKNPFLLITNTSWYIQKEEEIESINTMATQFKNQIDIIVLYWDTLKNVKQLEKEYSKDIILTYVDETKNESENIVSTFKHSFGAPACFYVSNNKQLVSINKKFELYKETINTPDISFTDTYKRIAFLIFENDNSPKGTITTLDDEPDEKDY
ncbi:MAG TPA: hypothetical protein VGA80_13100 [Flavobacteriaceae bacterium]